MEDNADLAANVANFLWARGDSVDFSRDGVTGLHRCVTGEYDAVVPDLALPGLDGVDPCRALHTPGRSTVPVLVLTTRDGGGRGSNPPATPARRRPTPRPR